MMSGPSLGSTLNHNVGDAIFLSFSPRLSPDLAPTRDRPVVVVERGDQEQLPGLGAGPSCPFIREQDAQLSFA